MLGRFQSLLQAGVVENPGISTVEDRAAYLCGENIIPGGPISIDIWGGTDAQHAMLERSCPRPCAVPAETVSPAEALRAGKSLDNRSVL